MSVKLRLRLTMFLLCTSLLLLSKPAKAIDRLQRDAIGAAIGIAAAGAAIGIGIYFAVHHNRTLTGCVVATPTGLTLANEGNQQTFALIGDTASIKPGDRIKVSGKKKKKDLPGQHTFLVERFSKDYGGCKVTP